MPMDGKEKPKRLSRFATICFLKCGHGFEGNGPGDVN